MGRKKNINDLVTDIKKFGKIGTEALRFANSQLGAEATTVLKHKLNVAGRNGKGAGKKTVSSNKGEYPRRQSGLLRTSISFLTFGGRNTEILHFGSNVTQESFKPIKYAEYVDKIRPYLFRVFDPLRKKRYRFFLKEQLKKLHKEKLK